MANIWKSLLLIVVLVSLTSFEKGLVSGKGFCVDSWLAPCNVQGVRICVATCQSKYPTLVNSYCQTSGNVAKCACAYRC